MQLSVRRRGGAVGSTADRAPGQAGAITTEPLSPLAAIKSQYANQKMMPPVIALAWF
jgi:hypothetical protein